MKLNKFIFMFLFAAFATNQINAAPFNLNIKKGIIAGAAAILGYYALSNGYKYFNVQGQATKNVFGQLGSFFSAMPGLNANINGADVAKGRHLFLGLVNSAAATLLTSKYLKTDIQNVGTFCINKLKTLNQ